MKYHAIGYLIILAMLAGCASFPVCPEVSVKICPVQSAQVQVSK